MLKKEKGITLIALIITIIVMLILVGVTINVAINGGLFEKAETAAIGTEKQAIYEQIISNMELTNDGKISVKGTFDNVVTEFGADKVTNINPAAVDENTTEVTFSVVGKTGTYNYKISAESIEKDLVQTSQSLVYGKIYESNIINDNGEALSVVFSKEYNYALILGELSSNPLALRNYSYNEQEKSIAIDGYNGYNFILSEDGRTISMSYNGMNFTFTLTDNVYEPKEGIEFEMYAGLYYNSNNKKFIHLNENTNGSSAVVSVWVEGEGYLGNSSSLSDLNITVIDSKHIQRNDITYELLEAGEFK